MSRAEEIARGLFEVSQFGSGQCFVYLDGVSIASTWSRDDADEIIASRAATIARAIESALAERDAGEAERVAHAVAAEREALIAALRERRDGTDPAHCSGLNVAINMIQLRARATSPAPEPVAAERAVIDAAVALCGHPYGQGCQWAEAYDGLERAVDALVAARKGGEHG